MKVFRNGILASGMILSLASCGDSSESGRSTPIDSTNMSGTAPVQYSEGTPGTPVDTTIHAHDTFIADSLRAGPGRTPGSGSNTSNTTDKRSTSGSANSGDADKDRKK